MSSLRSRCCLYLAIRLSALPLSLTENCINSCNFFIFSANESSACFCFRSANFVCLLLSLAKVSSSATFASLEKGESSTLKLRLDSLPVTGCAELPAFAPETNEVLCELIP